MESFHPVKVSSWLFFFVNDGRAGRTFWTPKQMVPSSRRPLVPRTLTAGYKALDGSWVEVLRINEPTAAAIASGQRDLGNRVVDFCMHSTIAQVESKSATWITSATTRVLW